LFPVIAVFARKWAAAPAQMKTPGPKLSVMEGCAIQNNRSDGLHA